MLWMATPRAPKETPVRVASIIEKRVAAG
jgi:hypothetical protein